MRAVLLICVNAGSNENTKTKNFNEIFPKMQKLPNFGSVISTRMPILK